LGSPSRRDGGDDRAHHRRSVHPDQRFAAPSAKRSGARLILTSTNPITISGHGFRPRVRVDVRLMMKRTFARSPRANRNGAFTVSFPAVIDRCSSWSVSAGQPRQTTVVLRGPAKPACAPASTP
jgi:hypothetical protein